MGYLKIGFENDEDVEKVEVWGIDFRGIKATKVIFYKWDHAEGHFQHWLRLRYWTLDEAIKILLGFDENGELLLQGFDPEAHSETTLDDWFECVRYLTKEICTIHQSDIDALTRLMRGFEGNHSPNDWIEFATRMHIEIPWLEWQKAKGTMNLSRNTILMIYRQKI